jgi:phosphate uptake regulator
MFKWLRGTDDGLADVEDRFVGMLSDGRHVFDLAMSARLGGADPDSVADSLYKTEERTDEAEREIRRRVIVHASVYGTADLAACLMYMSIAKDAERIADLSKNVFELSQAVGPPPPGELRDDLIATRDTVSPMIVEAARIFSDDDQEAAHEFIERARDVQRHCMRWISRLVREEVDVPQPAASALTFRHMARICANLLNITSAVVMPLDQLDYPERDAEDQAD